MALNESLVKFFVELYDFNFGGWGGEYGLYPCLSIVCFMFFGRQYLSEDIFCVMQLIFLFFFLLVVFGVAAEEYWCGVFDE